MRSKVLWALASGVLLALVLAISACGSDSGTAASRAPWRTSSHRRRRPRPTRRRAGSCRCWRRATSTTSTPAPPTTSSRYMIDLGDPAAAARLAAPGRREPEPGPRHRRARGLERRQDDHLQDQAGNQVLAAGQPRGRLRRLQVRDRARHCCPASPTATSPTYLGDMVGLAEAQRAAAKNETVAPGHHGDRVSRRPDAGDQAHRHELGRRDRRARAAGRCAGAGGVREAVRRREPLHLWRAPGRDRPVHDRERLLG